MVSVLTNTPNRHCHFYLLTDYISEKNKRRFSQVEEQYANCSIHYQLITEKIFDSFHRNIDYLVSPVSYYRYIIPELYPQLDKALYLDGDLVVNGSLEKLWDTDITDYLCAGVHDLWIENINYKPQIGFSSDELYINAGVLLLNIPKMREKKIYEKLCETTISLGKQIQFQDQDIINIVCRGRVKELPERYNFTTENAIKHPQERDKAAIIHYTGRAKPWSVWKCPNPQSRLYFDYLKKTPYKNDIWDYRFKRSKYKIVRRFKKIFGIKSR
jgi:lipopolysaccharide biosynthesis glycosyltransferase